VTKDAALPQFSVLLRPVLPITNISHVITTIHMKRSKSVRNILFNCLSLGTKRESTTFSQKANAKSAMETSHTACQDKVLDTTNSRKSDAYGFMRLTRPDIGTLCGEEFNSKPLALLNLMLTPTNALFYNLYILAIS
jgi:hypothetical protein